MYKSRELWVRFESVLAQRAPDFLTAFLPPATPREIEDAEAELDLVFPGELRAAYLRHNGSSRDGQFPSFFLPCYSNWFSLSELKDQWELNREIALANWPDDCESLPDDERNQGKVRADVWNIGRIPVGRFTGSHHLFVDLLPGATGSVGQLVKDVDMSGDCTDDSVVAISFDAYLALFTDRVEQGLITYAPGQSWVNQRGQGIFDWATLSG
jgi:cell wall assembly regulator SMI1